MDPELGMSDPSNAEFVDPTKAESPPTDSEIAKTADFLNSNTIEALVASNGKPFDPEMHAYIEELLKDQRKILLADLRNVATGGKFENELTSYPGWRQEDFESLLAKLGQPLTEDQRRDLTEKRLAHNQDIELGADIGQDFRASESASIEEKHSVEPAPDADSEKLGRIMMDRLNVLMPEKNEPARGKEKTKKNIAKGVVAGLLIFGYFVSSESGKKSLVDLVNAFDNWNPYNIKYLYQDYAFGKRQSALRLPKPLILAEEIESITVEDGTLDYGKKSTLNIQGVEFQMELESGALEKAYQEHTQFIGSKKFIINNEAITNLLTFEYKALKPPENAQEYRQFILDRAKTLLFAAREHRRERFRQDHVARRHPLLEEAKIRWENLKLDPFNTEDFKQITELNKNAYAQISALGEEVVVYDYPPELSTYEKNPGPQNIEELLDVAQNIVGDIHYDAAVESWLEPTTNEQGFRGFRPGKGNPLNVVFSADGTPVDTLLMRSKEGVCRHYAEAFASVVAELKTVFPSRFQNVYVTTSSSSFKIHEFNSVFLVESPTKIKSIVYEPQAKGGANILSDTPAYELLELMYQRNMVAKNDFYQMAANYFEGGGVESKVDFYAFIDRLAGDNSDQARRVAKDVFNMAEEHFDSKYQLAIKNRNTDDQAHWQDIKKEFKKETAMYRNKLQI